MQRRSRRDWLGAFLTAVALCVSAGTASAHGSVGGGIETPIPLWLLYTGAGATVAVTAGWLTVGERRTGDGPTGRRRSVSRPTAKLLQNVGRSLGLAGLAAVVVGGLVGPQIGSENVATVLFWPVWLKGIGLVAVLVGSPWRVVSPWGTLYAGLARLEGREPALLGGYPDRLAHWPALIGFLAVVGVVENLTTLPRSPRLTAVLVAGYALAMVVGALLFGRPWLRRADALSVLYRLLGRVAPVEVVRADGGYRVGLRPPWRGCLRAVADRSVAAFAVATVYTVSFDGFTDTPAFQTLLAAVGDDAGQTAAAVGSYLAGFGLFLASYWLAVRLVDRLGSEGRDHTGARIDRAAVAFAGSLLPIAAAYEVAHSYPFVLRNVGRLLELSTGGTVAPSLIAWLPVTAFWTSQLLLVVGGHLVAVVAAHAVATDRYGEAARRAHLPLVVVMVGYTVLSLWIVSQPVVA